MRGIMGAQPPITNQSPSPLRPIRSLYQLTEWGRGQGEMEKEKEKYV